MRWTAAGLTIGRAGLARCATFGNRDAGNGLAEPPRTFTEEVYNMDYLNNVLEGRPPRSQGVRQFGGGQSARHAKFCGQQNLGDADEVLRTTAAQPHAAGTAAATEAVPAGGQDDVAESLLALEPGPEEVGVGAWLLDEVGWRSITREEEYLLPQPYPGAAARFPRCPRHSCL